MTDGVIIGDGAMGTMLQSVGMPPDLAPEKWNLDRPDVVRSIHGRYVEAGAQIIGTNTFGGNRIKLRDTLHEEVWQMNYAGARLARDVAGDHVLVAGSMGPTGGLLAPWGDLAFADVMVAYQEQAEALAAGGVDVLLIETMMDMQEARAAFLGAAKTRLPIGVQLTFQETGRTLMGTPAQVAAGVFHELGATWVGTNCGTGPLAMVDIVTNMQLMAGNISAFPNAGLPTIKDGHEVYPMEPEKFAAYASELAKAGAILIGGCCGTTPHHISLLRSSLKDQPFTGSLPDMLRETVSSSSHTPCSTWVVGEEPSGQGDSAIFLASRTALFPIERGGDSYHFVNASSLRDLPLGSAWEVTEEDSSVVPVALLNIPKDFDAQEIAAALTELQMVPAPVVFASDTVSSLQIALEHYCGRAGVLVPEDGREQDYVELARTLGALAVYA